MIFIRLIIALLGSLLLGGASWYCGQAAYATYHLWGNADINSIHGVIAWVFGIISVFSGLGVFVVLGQVFIKPPPSA
jgi:hypothetical protein